MLQFIVDFGKLLYSDTEFRSRFPIRIFLMIHTERISHPYRGLINLLWCTAVLCLLVVFHGYENILAMLMIMVIAYAFGMIFSFVWFGVVGPFMAYSLFKKLRTELGMSTKHIKTTPVSVLIEDFKQALHEKRMCNYS